MDKFKHKLSWDEKAKLNPLYAIMSVEDFRDSTAEFSPEELKQFLRDGEEKVNAFIKPWLQQTEQWPQPSVMEYGCGIGRLLNPLSRSLNDLAGVDISRTMIARSREIVPESVQTKALLDNGDIPFSDERFDAVFSYAVFQHIQQRSSLEKSIKEISRVLRKNGQARLQFAMPSFCFRNGFTPRKDSYAFENFSLIYGWSKRFPIWRIRIHRHTAWAGVRLGYNQLIRKLKTFGLMTTGVEITGNLIWFHAQKQA